MGVVIDGLNSYSLRPDGTREYLPPSAASMSIDGKEIYRYSAKTGVLQLAVDPNDLERLVSALGPIPPEGKDIILNDPFGIPNQFRGVRKLELMRAGQRPSLKERIMGYFRS